MLLTKKSLSFNINVDEIKRIILKEIIDRNPEYFELEIDDIILEPIDEGEYNDDDEFEYFNDIWELKGLKVHIKD